MANTSAPSGLSPVYTSNGSPWNQQATLYCIPSANVSAFYIGDIVISAQGVTQNSNGDWCPNIAKAAASGIARGVVVGFLLPDANPAGGNFDPSIIYVPATKTKNYFAMVVDDPGTIFEVTDDGDTVASTWVGQNINFTVAAPSSPNINPVSATVLDGSTVGTTSTLPLKILGLKRVPGNTAAAYARWLVRFNRHEFFGSTSGV